MTDPHQECSGCIGHLDKNDVGTDSIPISWNLFETAEMAAQRQCFVPTERTRERLAEETVAMNNRDSDVCIHRLIPQTDMPKTLRLHNRTSSQCVTIGEVHQHEAEARLFFVIRMKLSPIVL